MLVIPGASRFAYSLNVTLATRRGSCSRRLGVAGYSPRGNRPCGSLRWRLQICRDLKVEIELEVMHAVSEAGQI